MKIILSFLIFLFNFNESHSQSIVQAAGNNRGTSQFQYDPAIISQGRIEYIEKVEFDFSKNRLDTGFVSERHQFRHDGRPIREVYTNGYDRKTMWIDFEYDAQHTLIKTVTSPGFDWTYGKGYLKKANECGDSARIYENIPIDVFKSLIGFSGCLPEEFSYLLSRYQRNLDLEMDTVEFAIFGLFFIEGKIPYSPCSGNYLRVYKIDSTIEVQSEWQQEMIYQDRNETHYSRNKRFYDFNLKILRTESYSWAHCDASVGREEIYEYFNNGLLKSVTTFDGKRLSSAVNYTYFDNGLMKSIESSNGEKLVTKVEYRCSNFVVKKAPAVRF